ncbi:MAG TPA: hypothetical protein VGR36_00055 [Candidatus Acidoferrales bacterium]|nr:hypothetical protein [Candidatus Acidoferrales bacterium]
MPVPSPKRKSEAAENPTKKSLILKIAREMGQERFTQNEIEEICRRVIAEGGPASKTPAEYVESVLKEAGLRVAWSAREETEDRYEEEFKELLHFADLGEAEMCIVRLDELLRKFEGLKEPAAAERVREVARLGRRRAEMIAHNQKVDAAKREEKNEIARWFAIWLETPDAFFDWLEVRKQSREFQKKFAARGEEDSL